MKTKITLPHFVVCISLAAISVGVAMTAHAAEQLETVIVSASKIEQDIQRTAVSMQSLSGAALFNMGANNVTEIAKFTPGLQLDQTGGSVSATVRIRGIGTPGFSALDPSIPIFIDGVAQARTGAGFEDLLDISRVEVLRGPQGTLYGRNSTAGAINIWTQDANSYRWDGALQAQVGNYNDRELKGAINIPIVEGLLAARISAFSTKQDGYIHNASNDNKTENGYADRFGGRAKIALTPADNFDIEWITNYSQSIGHPGKALIIVPALYTDYANSAGGIVSQGGAHGLPQDDAYNGKVYHDIYEWTYDTNFSTSATVNWDIENGFLAGNSFTSITAYNLNKSNQLLDRDASLLDYQTSAGDGATDSWSQELRLSSDAGERFEYVGGLFYYADRVDSTQDTDSYRTDAIAAANTLGFVAVGSPPVLAATTASLNADNVAIFGQVTYNFSAQLSLIAGLRESWVQKKGNSYLTTTPAYISPKNIVDNKTLIETDTSGALKARYLFDDDIMVYASYDHGFKAGGFNRIIVPTLDLPITYHKEVSNNYEVGAKTQWFDKRVQANVDVFYTDFKGFHNQTIDKFNDVIVENIAKVTSDGIEFDLQALAAPRLILGGGAAYYNPRVRSDTAAGSVLQNGDLINDTSQYSANLNAEYSRPLMHGPAENFVRVDWSYRSRYVLGDDHYQDGYSLSDIRFGVRHLDNHWQLIGWVKNIFDKEYAVGGISDFAGQSDGLAIYQGAPRTYGMTVQYDY